jgi:hypothetical protein
MGYSFDEAMPFSVVTSKSVERLKGERIWSISGEGKPRRYFLRDTWIVQECGRSEQSHFHNFAMGHGETFDPPVQLGELPWFASFLKSQGNFSLGLQQIRDEFACEFEALCSKCRPSAG